MATCLGWITPRASIMPKPGVLVSRLRAVRAATATPALGTVRMADKAAYQVGMSARRRFRPPMADQSVFEARRRCG